MKITKNFCHWVVASHGNQCFPLLLMTNWAARLYFQQLERTGLMYRITKLVVDLCTLLQEKFSSSAIKCNRIQKRNAAFMRQDLKTIMRCAYAAYDFNCEILKAMRANGHTITDVGCNSARGRLYAPMAKKVASGDYAYGFLFCGTGQGWT